MPEVHASIAPPVLLLHERQCGVKTIPYVFALAALLCRIKRSEPPEAIRQPSFKASK